MDKLLVRKLCLGTAQFGMDYGIANVNGKPSKGEVFKILEYARNVGIDMLDTASEYGDSEEVVGEYISTMRTKFGIISKMPKSENGIFNPEAYCKNTISRLKVPKLHGYLVRGVDAGYYSELHKQLSVLKKDGMIDKIGMSLYKTEALDAILEKNPCPEAVQIPYNIFDRRFERYFAALKKRGIEIYARSVFLQGFFFLDEAVIRRNFGAAAGAVAKLRDISEKKGIPVNAICLCFAMLNEDVDYVIIGIDSLSQLKDNMKSLGYMDGVKRLYDDLKSLRVEEEEVILPYNWK